MRHKIHPYLLFVLLAALCLCIWLLCRWAGAEKVFQSGEYTAYCYASWQELESLLGADA